jgi:hypothetical protein
VRLFGFFYWQARQKRAKTRAAGLVEGAAGGGGGGGGDAAAAPAGGGEAIEDVVESDEDDVDLGNADDLLP